MPGRSRGRSQTGRATPTPPAGNFMVDGDSNDMVDGDGNNMVFE